VAIHSLEEYLNILTKRNGNSTDISTLKNKKKKKEKKKRDEESEERRRERKAKKEKKNNATELTNSQQSSTVDSGLPARYIEETSKETDQQITEKKLLEKDSEIQSNVIENEKESLKIEKNRKTQKDGKSELTIVDTEERSESPNSTSTIDLEAEDNSTILSSPTCKNNLFMNKKVLKMDFPDPDGIFPLVLKYMYEGNDNVLLFVVQILLWCIIFAIIFRE
jgi:hypothetical protein